MAKFRFLLVFFWMASVCDMLAQQNVIFLIADDLGTDYCGFYEEAVDTANMPNVRSLLARGVRFRNAWATPYCSSTRASLLTGRYGFRTGVGTVIAGPGTPQLGVNEVTIPKLLKNNAGYATANVGKWHLNQQSPQNLSIPNEMGYDLYSGNFLGEISDYYNWKKIVNGQSITPNITNYATTETVDDAIEWLGGLDSGQPFFLWVAFNAPHTPFHAPPSSLHTVPGLTGTQGHIAQNPKLYFKAMIEAMDSEIGRLFNWLQENNAWNNTNIVFIGDNGNTKRVSQIADTSHTKGTLYEYGVRVPFVVAGPAIQQPGRVSDALVSTPDLFATSLEMAGLMNWPDLIPADKPVDSKSILPILKNESAAVRDWAFTELFTSTPTPDDGKTMRNGLYKLIRFDDGHEELYRLEDDPNEQNDLLLLPSLNLEAASNYTYLCGELQQLVGGSSCLSVAVNEPGVLLEKNWHIQPNPVNTILSVVNLSEGRLWSVRNLVGQELLRGISSAATFDLDVRNWPNGVYYFQAEGIGKCWVKN